MPRIEFIDIPSPREQRRIRRLLALIDFAVGAWHGILITLGVLTIMYLANPSTFE